MRAFLVFAALSLFSFGCARGPSSDAEARVLAKDRFSQVCSNFRLLASEYDGPSPTSIGGVAFAYEWRKKESKQEGVLITVASDGVTNVSFLTR